MSIYYTKYADSYLFKSTRSILKIDSSNIEVVDDYDQYNSIFSNNNLIQYCIGILGTFLTDKNKYLIVCTSVKLNCEIFGNLVYKVENFDILNLTSDSVDREDDEYLVLIEHHLKTNQLLYCKTLNLFTNFQRITQDENQANSFFYNFMNFNPQIFNINNNQESKTNYSSEFFWNEYLLKDFATVSSIDEFIIRVFYGFVEFDHILQDENIDVWLGIISRRSKYRAGTRYFKRGIDSNGNVANFNETEQFIIIKNLNNYNLLSYLQIRGSIPIYWAEINNLQYKPILSISNHMDSKSISNHFRDLKEKYSAEKIHIINLINSKGSELVVKHSFEYTVNELIKEEKDLNLNYIYFDFHKECKNLKYENLDKLLSQIENNPNFKKDFLNVQFLNGINDPGTNPKITILSTQSEIIRTNCMDCLDRTNVVQSMIAKSILFNKLNHFQIFHSKNINLNFIFNNIWFNNGNAISKSYSGTSALKGDYTKTGRRTYLGMWKDLINSLTRYYLNNFKDGYRQDSFDLFLGNYKPRFGIKPFIVPKPFKYQVMPYSLASSMFLFLSMFFMETHNKSRSNFFIMVNCVLIMSYSAWYIVKNGIQYINWPKLCDLEFLKKTKLINDDEFEGIEYSVSDDYNEELEKID